MTSLSGRFAITDDDLFRSLAADPKAKVVTGRVSETYEGYRDLHKDYVDSTKHYLIAVALLIASHFDLIDKFGFAGADFTEEAVSLASLLYVSFSLLLFSNYSSKMRVYLSVYSAELDSMDASSRLITMMRYPLACPGGPFSASAIMLRTHLISTKDLLLSVPLMLAIAVAYALLGIFALFILGDAVLQVARMPDQYWVLKYTAMGAFTASSVFWLATCRPKKIRHFYDEKVSVKS
jgi:hypothetical protein